VAPVPWRPQPEPKRRRITPLLIGAWVIVMVAAVVAVGIAFWPAGNHSPQSAVSPQTGGSVGGDDVAASPQDTGSQGAVQATEVNTLLDDMASSRSDLGKALTSAATCSALGDALPTIEKVVGEREQQLAKAKTLQVSALDSGDQLKDSLTRALQASLDADRAYLKWADNAQGCSGDTPTDSNFDRGGSISDKEATPAKEEFLRLWAPVAEREQQPARDRDHI
jgi:hypothetical protein